MVITMAETRKCTFSQASALWEMNRDTDFQGLILTVDLDRAGAGLCLCRRGALPQLLWEEPGTLDASWFPEASRTFFKEYPRETAAALLRQAKGSGWISAQKNYYRSGKEMLVSLPPVVVEDRSCTILCETLDRLLATCWDDAIFRVLQQAKKQLDLQEENLPRRILPVGALARLYLAEYRLREFFLEMPLPPDPLIRTWGVGEDPSQVVEAGMELFRQQEQAQRVLPFSLRLQTLCMVGDRLESRLLTLAGKNTPYESLGKVSYVGPIVVGPEDGLVLFADSQIYRIQPGFLRFGPDHPYRCVKVGLGIYQEKLSLFLRDGGQTKVCINLRIP